MRTKFLLAAICCLTYLANAQTDRKSMVLDQFRFMFGYGSRGGNDSLTFGYVDKNLNYICEPTFKAGSDFFGDYANVIKDGVCGLMDKSGKTTFFPQYEIVYKYYSTYLLVKRDGKFGCIRNDGTEVIPIIYDQIGFFSSGHVPVKNGEKWQILDSLGRSVVDSNIVLGYNSVHDFYVEFEGYYSDTTRNAKKPKKGILHLSRGVVVPPVYDELAGWFSDGLCWAKRNGKQGFVSDAGIEKIPLEYDELVSEFEEGLVTARKGDMWGFIDHQNKVVIPFEYERAYKFSEGLAAVKKNGKIGFIDKNNNLIIPFLFDPDWGYQFKEGLSIFKLHYKFGFINKKGEVVIAPTFASALKFEDGMARVTLPNKKAYFINKKGKLSSEFIEAWSFQNGIARVVVSK
jgi:hypothetical protein